jgi:hypothetical protein
VWKTFVPSHFICDIVRERKILRKLKYQLMLVVGTYLEGIELESFYDKEAGRVRVRPAPGQAIPTDLAIECSKQMRERYGIGKRFKTKSLKVCKKYDRIYLRAANQDIEPID